MKPHKHADLIKAWADGAEIECRFKSGNWRAVEYPDWANPLEEYRIKPEEKKPVVRYLWAYKITSGWRITDFLSEGDAAKCFGLRGYIRLDWSRTEFEE